MIFLFQNRYFFFNYIQLKQREETFTKETEYFKKEIENANSKITEMQRLINEKFEVILF